MGRSAIRRRLCCSITLAHPVRHREQAEKSTLRRSKVRPQSRGLKRDSTRRRLRLPFGALKTVQSRGAYRFAVSTIEPRLARSSLNSIGRRSAFCFFIQEDFPNAFWRTALLQNEIPEIEVLLGAQPNR
jgi:hypothetical protein